MREEWLLCWAKTWHKQSKDIGHYQIQKTAGKPLDLNIIQIYVPTSTRSDEDIEKFYGNLEQAKAQYRQQDPLIIMGNFNAKVGKGRQENVVRPHGLGIRNIDEERN